MKWSEIFEILSREYFPDYDFDRLMTDNRKQKRSRNIDDYFGLNSRQDFCYKRRTETDVRRVLDDHQIMTLDIEPNTKFKMAQMLVYGNLHLQSKSELIADLKTILQKRYEPASSEEHVADYGPDIVQRQHLALELKKKTERDKFDAMLEKQIQQLERLVAVRIPSEKLIGEVFSLEQYEYVRRIFFQTFDNIEELPPPPQNHQQQKPSILFPYLSGKLIHKDMLRKQFAEPLSRTILPAFLNRLADNTRSSSFLQLLAGEEDTDKVMNLADLIEFNDLENIRTSGDFLDFICQQNYHISSESNLHYFYRSLHFVFSLYNNGIEITRMDDFSRIKYLCDKYVYNFKPNTIYTTNNSKTPLYFCHRVEEKKLYNTNDIFILLNFIRNV